MDKIKCSIIIPLYHGKKYISALTACVEACAEYSSNVYLELILSNDAPDEELGEDLKACFISVKILNTDQNRGIHGARVRGLQSSTGDYILFLDQDDRIVPEYFDSQLNAIGSADAVICNALSGGRIKHNTDRPLYKAADRKCMIGEGCMILSPGRVLIRRTAIPQVWMENIMWHNGADDWLLWLCMHSARKQFAINDNVLFIREIHYHNTSFDSLKMTESEREVVEIIESQALLYEEERKRLRGLLSKIQRNRIKEIEKFKKMFFLQNDWMLAISEGKTVADYLKKKQIKSIALYGYGYLGKTLLKSLEKSDIEISYVIDKNADYLDTPVKCCTLEKKLIEVGAVIVTLVMDCREMVDAEIRKKMKTEIFWLEDVIADISKCNLDWKNTDKGVQDA